MPQSTAIRITTLGAGGVVIAKIIIVMTHIMNIKKIIVMKCILIINIPRSIKELIG
jgi:multisubunit Na+/H+ antiporter MnhG subunit